MLLAVKAGDLKKSLPPDPGPTRTSGVYAGLNHSQSLMASNFAALQPTQPKFLASKDLIFLKTVSKFQENSSILKVNLPCQSDLISYHKRGFVDSQMKTTVQFDFHTIVFHKSVSFLLKRA